MKINTEKSEIMTISREQKEINLQINNQKLKQVQEFKYLGSIFTADESFDREIETRIQQANKVNYQLTPIYSNRNKKANHKCYLYTNSRISVPNLDINKRTREKTFHL